MTKMTTRLINEHKLAIFAEVVRQGSITQAAKQLCMTQPAVSSTLRKIEQHFDVKLFNLIGKKIQLTDAAHILYDQWNHIAHEFENLHLRMEQYKRGLRGSIRIIMVSSAKYFIPAVMHLFLQRFPHIEFHCDIRGREKIIPALRNNDYQIGILTDAPQHKDTTRIDLGANKLTFIVNPANPLTQYKQITVKTLAQQTFITREPEAVISQILYNTFAQRKLTLTVLFAIDSTEAVKQAVISNLGIALVPAISVANELKHGILTTLNVKGIDVSNEWFLLTHQRSRNNLLTNNFIAYVKRYCDNK